MQEQGEATREANFALPPGSAAILGQVTFHESPDERAERLRCAEPDTGREDALRAFSMELAWVTRPPERSAKPAGRGLELE
eukprot:8236710-Pyramimonas_sp.AAC.1